MELSTPQRSRGRLFDAGFSALRMLLGGALLLGTVAYAFVFAAALFRDPSNLLPPMLVGVGVGFVWVVFVAIF